MANVCATCGAAHQAAPPMPNAGPPAAPSTEPAGDADAQVVQDLVARVTALESAMSDMMQQMGSLQVASLVASIPPMPAFA